MLTDMQDDTMSTSMAEPSPTNASTMLPKWVVLWTHSNCERLVRDQLVLQGFEVFLPELPRWSRRGNLRHLLRVPMFPGYLFLHHPVDQFSYIEVRKIKGLVRILGRRWDQLATVPECEIESIQKVLATDTPTLPHPYLRAGQRVKVMHGPLRNAEGFLVQSEPRSGLLVLSVDILQRSVAVQIDCTLVAAV